jgi:hypothetical protein
MSALRQTASIAVAAIGAFALGLFIHFGNGIQAQAPKPLDPPPVGKYLYIGRVVPELTGQPYAAILDTSTGKIYGLDEKERRKGNEGPSSFWFLIADAPK